MLWIENSEASTSEIETGVSAAESFLASKNITVATAHKAHMLQCDGEAFDQTAVDAWDDAENEAFKAAFAQWAEWPSKLRSLSGLNGLKLL